ncbi:hypothetical protein NBRC116583_29670 [Arenicella sp. 4NH20-0111]
MSKEEFVNMQLKMIEGAQQMQEELGERNRKMLKEALPKEDFEKLMAEDQEYEAQAKAQTAECLGISEQELELYENSFNEEFQLELVKSCSSELPESITVKSMNWSDNTDLEAFQACTEAEVAKRTKIPQKKLKECSESNEDRSY